MKQGYLRYTLTIEVLTDLMDRSVPLQEVTEKPDGIVTHRFEKFMKEVEELLASENLQLVNYENELEYEEVDVAEMDDVIDQLKVAK